MENTSSDEVTAVNCDCALSSVAKALGVPIATVMTWIRQQRLEALRKPGPSGPRFVVPLDSLHTFLTTYEVSPTRRLVRRETTDRATTENQLRTK